MPADYGPGARALQDRFDTRRLADRLDERFLTTAEITADRKALIERQPMFFLATADEQGRPQCSYKGGDPGFVRVLGADELCFPSYDGNGMFLSLGNLAVNPHVGLLFVDFAGDPPARLRISGVASADPGDPLVATYPGAQLVVRVRATAVFPNCPRYVHRMEVREPSRFVPAADGSAPVPGWKRTDWACDVLPAGDPASRPGPNG
jgi:predicted pyridoxine 5'-phosphate oxidase superfamily flavin-nucleotide-binding protein